MMSKGKKGSGKIYTQQQIYPPLLGMQDNRTEVWLGSAADVLRDRIHQDCNNSIYLKQSRLPRKMYHSYSILIC
jgi:hypothetical protein